MTDNKNQLPDAKEEFIKRFGEFSKVFLDYWAVVDQKGRIVKCHQQLHLLTGATSKEMLKGDSLDQFLTIEYDGAIFGIQEFLNAKECKRIDEVTAATDKQVGLKLTVSFFSVYDGKGLRLRWIYADSRCHSGKRSPRPLFCKAASFYHR